jgi:hypothetical protein
MSHIEPASKNEEILEILEKPVETIVGKGILKEIFDNTLDYLNEAFEEPMRRVEFAKLSLPTSFNLRRAVYIGKKAINNGSKHKNIFTQTEFINKFNWVNDLTNIKEIFNDTEQIIEETDYCGSEPVKLYRLLLPKQYVVKVMRVRAKHMPDPYFYNQDVYVKLVLEDKLGPDGAVVRRDERARLFCWKCEPLRTDRPWRNIPIDVIIKNYRCVSIRVFPNNIIKSWDVGLDPECSTIEETRDEFVTLGTDA